MIYQKSLLLFTKLLVYVCSNCNDNNNLGVICLEDGHFDFLAIFDEPDQVSVITNRPLIAAKK